MLTYNIRRWLKTNLDFGTGPVGFARSLSNIDSDKINFIFDGRIQICL